MATGSSAGYDMATLERARDGADLHAGDGLAVSWSWVARANISGPVTLTSAQPSPRGRYPHAFALGRWQLEKCQTYVDRYPEVLRRPLVAGHNAAPRVVVLDGQVEGVPIRILRTYHDAFVRDGDKLTVVRWMEHIVYILVVRDGTVMAAIMGHLPDNWTAETLDLLPAINRLIPDQFEEPAER
jgi:hypothetical protein